LLVGAIAENVVSTATSSYILQLFPDRPALFLYMALLKKEHICPDVLQPRDIILLGLLRKSCLKNSKVERDIDYNLLALLYCRILLHKQ
jgi:hypothetical protein